MPFKDPLKAKEKNREYQKKWYQKNKKTQKQRVRDRTIRNRLWIYQYKKEHKCQRCGASHPAILDFHHCNADEKDFLISESKDLSITRIKTEIKKCILLCANCHRIEHWNECTGPFKNRKVMGMS